MSRSSKAAVQMHPRGRDRVTVVAGPAVETQKLRIGTSGIGPPFLRCRRERSIDPLLCGVAFAQSLGDQGPDQWGPMGSTATGQVGYKGRLRLCREVLYWLLWMMTAAC
jgi:hypothetical protein